jgi:hypothetical protein
MSFQQLLYRSIANNPVIWLDLAFRIKSRVLFRESLIHAAGQYNTHEVQNAINSTMDDRVREILTQKANKISKAVQSCQLKILNYYPDHMHRQFEIGIADRESFGRASYCNDIFSWMAMTFFQQWLGEFIARDETHHGEDMGFHFIKLIARSHTEYLTKDVLREKYRDTFPTSNKGLGVIEARINEIRQHIRAFVGVRLRPVEICICACWGGLLTCVQDLLQNKSALDIITYPVAYFTCTTVEFEEFPFAEEESSKRPATPASSEEAETDEE